jgi:hypothetical protein
LKAVPEQQIPKDTYYSFRGFTSPRKKGLSDSIFVPELEFSEAAFRSCFPKIITSRQGVQYTPKEENPKTKKDTKRSPQKQRESNLVPNTVPTILNSHITEINSVESIMNFTSELPTTTLNIPETGNLNLSNNNSTSVPLPTNNIAHGIIPNSNHTTPYTPHNNSSKKESLPQKGRNTLVKRTYNEMSGLLDGHTGSPLIRKFTSSSYFPNRNQ